ncbi:MAG: hypothetical protein ACYTEX_26040 [Planctomycetota bacterium]
MTIREALTDWLKSHGFEGLSSEMSECGCALDDLAPCDGPYWDCEPGHKIPCPGPEGCSLDGDCAFHIASVLSPVAKALVEARQDKQVRDCHWSESTLAFWVTGCGQNMTLPYGLPSDYQYYFCPFCGAFIQEVLRCEDYLEDWAGSDAT